MQAQTKITLFSSLAVAMFLSGDVLAQGVITGKKKTSAASKATTSKMTKPAATDITKTTWVETAHKKYVSPMVDAWEKLHSDPIRDYRFSAQDFNYCTVAFYDSGLKDYWVVPLGAVELRDMPKTNSTESTQYTAYSHTATFKCKSGSCIYRQKDKSQKKSTFTGKTYTRIKYKNGNTSHNGFDNIQAYYTYYDYANKATAACQRKSIPPKYQGSRG